MVKRIVLIIALLFANWHTQVLFAQIAEKKLECPQRLGPIFKTNALPTVWGPIPLTSEWRIVAEIPVALRQSSQIGISYLGKSPFFSWFEAYFNSRQSGPPAPKILVSGYRFQISHKFYSQRDYAPYGLYISPHFSYSTAKLTTAYLNSYNVYFKALNVNANILGGYQVVVRETMIVDFFTGFGYKNNQILDVQYSVATATKIDTEDFGWYYNNPFKFTLGFNFGIYF